MVGDSLQSGIIDFLLQVVKGEKVNTTGLKEAGAVRQSIRSVALLGCHLAKGGIELDRFDLAY